MATPEEIEATPREHIEMEALAILAADTFTADQQIYERIVEDMQRIRAANPELEGVHYRPREPWLRVELRFGSCFEFDIDDHPAIRCLNDYYGATGLGCGWDIHSSHVIVRFDGIYIYRMLASEYEQLPGITSVRWDYWYSDGPTVCVAIEGTGFHYLFDRAEGDCPSGCIFHDYYYFYTAARGGPILADRWPDGNDPRPDWTNLFSHCPEVELSWY